MSENICPSAPQVLIRCPDSGHLPNPEERHR
jgi:hypothetical protein